MGTELAVYQITCPFCLERGNFKVVFHAEKKKPNGRKKLNFDTLECGNCKGYVMCLWSAGDRLHSYRVLPWPMRIEKHPDEWPENVGRFWVQAHRSLTGENWDAGAVIARSALQAALRDQKAKGANLKQEIDDLASKGLSADDERVGRHSSRARERFRPPQTRPASDTARRCQGHRTLPRLPP